MFIYSLKSSRKILHSPSCYHISKTEPDRIASVDLPEKIYRKGYRLCRHCSVIAKIFKKEEKGIYEQCQSLGMSVFADSQRIKIITPYSKWVIIPDADGINPAVYHKNTFSTPNDSESRIKGFHFQSVLNSSVCEYLKYIAAHDGYRLLHPAEAYIPHNGVKKKKTFCGKPPKEYTPKFKKYQERMKKKDRKRSISRVLCLIDSIREENGGPARAALAL